MGNRLGTFWDMLNLPFGQLFATYHRLVAFEQSMNYMDPQVGEGIKMSLVSYERFLATADEFHELCAQASLTVTELAATGVKRNLRDVKPGADDPEHMYLLGGVFLRVKNSLQEVVTCLRFETASKTALMLPPEKAHLFEPPTPLYGPEVRGKYPSALYDIDEAGKCLALGRSTAAVFHLMRVMEIALKAVSAHLGVTAPSNPNWGTWLGGVRGECQRRGRGWADFNFFQDVWQRIDAIKDAQRNQTMHVETVYTEEEAMLIFKATEGFMKKIASRMDEGGLPLA